MVEFKKDFWDNVYKFIEINLCFWFSYSLIELVGVYFVYMYYLYLIGQYVKFQFE